MRTMTEPYPPEFMPGDLVEVVGAEWPEGSGRIKSWMGLFQDVGQPPSMQNVPTLEISAKLNETCVARINNGERCLVVAVRFCDADKKWYYLLRGMGFKKCFGWTRSVARLRKEQL